LLLLSLTEFFPFTANNLQENTMSALLTSNFPVTNSHPISELAATQEVSRITSGALRYREALGDIFSVVLAIPGVWRVSMEAQPELAEWLTLDRTGRPPTGQWGSAIAPLEAGLHQWGEFRICFELSSNVSRSPLRFAKYLAQQIAGLLDRTALRDQRDLLRLRISALRRWSRTRAPRPCRTW
jgi:hypothetical protein